jgi:hypothetical protein
MTKNDFELRHHHYNVRLIQCLEITIEELNFRDEGLVVGEVGNCNLPLPIDPLTHSTPFCRLTFSNKPKLNLFVKFLYGDVYPSTNILDDDARN